MQQHHCRQGGGGMLSREELLFLIICILNLLVAVIYLLYGIGIVGTVHGRQEKEVERTDKKKENRRTYLIRFIVMVLCPVIGPLYFLISYLVYITIFRQSVDLEDVVFSKERVKTRLKADEERERDMVPLEEALSVSDKKSVRMLMLNVIRGNVKESMETIMTALDSEDSETSHYAASILLDELNEFRMNVQKLYSEIKAEEDDETESEEMLIDYMDMVLGQKVFDQMEQERFVQMMDEAGESLYKKDAVRLTPERYESLCLKLLERKEFEKVKKWCTRLEEQYPDVLPAYTCRMKLYFTMNEKEQFFKVMEDLKRSKIVIDQETLELIRIFS